MRRPSEAAAAKTRGLQAEIVAVFLYQHIRRNLAGAKERMLCHVNAHRLRNAGLVFVAGLDFPALGQLDQRQSVRRVAVDLVRGRENKGGLGTEQTGRLKQIQRADGIHAEVGVGVAGGPVVRGLGGGVNHQGDVLAQLLEKFFDRSAVADVEIMMFVLGDGLDKFLAIAQRGSFLAKKPLPEIVVDADDLETFPGKALDAFRTNQSGGTGDNHKIHDNGEAQHQRNEARRARGFSMLKRAVGAAKIPLTRPPGNGIIQSIGRWPRHR